MPDLPSVVHFSRQHFGHGHSAAYISLTLSGPKQHIVPKPQEYTIGWICALSKELIAARAFLDVVHDPVDSAATNDTNSYTLGGIGKHNVVIAVLPSGQYGLVNAAAALKDMTWAFPNLRAVLMVGIGGGVPSEKDVRLGDVVVGTVGPSNGGVIQYDYGRAIQGKEFAVTGHLNQPPMAFLTAMAALHATYEMKGHSINSNIEKALQKHKRLQKKYNRPDPSTDRLYEANFVHQGSKGVPCSELCGDDKLVHRDERGEDENNPAIHCGSIASGNQLMKDALLRDSLAAKHSVLCFEMEAAGLMNHFPCVVVRGICDYCDSHKNDQWQEYAAMVAAAYAKDLLLQVAPTSLQKEARIEALLEQVSAKVEDIYEIATESSRDIKSLSSSVYDDAISRWLNPADPSVDHNKAREACHSGTGEWLLNNPQYVAWKSRMGSFLWLNGNSGQGKTILSSTVIEDIRNSHLSDSAILYFYITFTNSQKQSLDAILRSLINQLYHSRPDSRPPITSLHLKCGGGSGQATVAELKSTFRDMLSVGGEVFIIIDALDEYHNRSTQRDDLFAWIESFHTEPVNTHLLVTSRPEHDIQTFIATWAEPGSIISLKTENVGRDISNYIRDEVVKSRSFRRWHGHTSTQDTIVRTLTTKADGGFRWVALQLECLKDCISTEEVNAALKTLPETLHGTYYRALGELKDTKRKYVIRILQFLAYSDIVMDLEMAVDALAINPTASPGSRFIMKERMPLPDDISSLCSTLFAVVPMASKVMLDQRQQSQDSQILQLAHSSVKEFILSRPRTEFDGLLTEPTASLAITEICLVYSLEIDWSLSDPQLIHTYHLLPFALDRWVVDASCPQSSLITFSNLSMELFSNDSLFRRWRDPISNRSSQKWGMRNIGSLTHDQLFYASWSGDKSCVKKLIEARAMRDVTDSSLDNALFVASQFGRLEAVALLIREGADVNTQGEYGATTLSVASRFGHLDVVKHLIEQGADLNASGVYDGTALCAASVSGHLDVVTHLVEKGADVMTPGGLYENAIHAAFAGARLDILRFFQNYEESLKYIESLVSRQWSTGLLDESSGFRHH